MLKKLIVTLIGKTLGKRLKLVDDYDTSDKAPEPGQTIVKVPWYQSKAKLSAILMVVAIAINKLSGPVFGHEITIPDEVFRVLEALGIYGLRDALKQPAPEPKA